MFIKPDTITKLVEIIDYEADFITYLCLLVKLEREFKKQINDYFDPSYIKIVLYKFSKIITDKLNENEFGTKYSPKFNGTILLENKTINLEKAIEYCKEKLDSDFHLEVGRFVQNEYKIFDRDFLFEKETNHLKCNDKYINDIKNTKQYKYLDDFKVVNE